jgi:Tfp pilus assembly protein PilF
VAALDLQEGHAEEARAGLEELVKETPDFSAAHVALATVYYRLKRKPEGDRERAIVQKLNAQIQAKQQQGIDIK